MKRVVALLKTLWYVVSLRCEEADRIRANFNDPAVTRAQKAGERMHSALCGSCHAARKAMRDIGDALGDFDKVGREAPLPVDARSRIDAVLRDRQDAS